MKEIIERIIDSVDEIKKVKKEDSRKVLYKFLLGKNTFNEILTD